MKPFVRRLTVCLLAAVMLILSAVPSIAAEAKAADMRLVKTEGEVTLENASGREMTVRKNMKLYSGYTVSTEEESYAYLTLDEDKAVKLDANSELEVRKKGKKLELMLKSGKLIFDVEKPLADGETMNIRTSTMVTGIRGTVGIVTTDAEGSALYLLEGSAVISRADGSDAKVVSAGSVGYSNDSTVTVTTADPDDLPGFVAEMLTEDSDLVDRIEKATGWDLTPVILDAPKRLEQDEDSAAEYGKNPVPVKQIYSDNTAGYLLPGNPWTTPVTPSVPSTPSTPPATPVTGSIAVELNLTDEQGAVLNADTDKTYTFTLADANGTAQTVTVTVAAGAATGTATVSDLAQGTYTVSMDTAGLAGDAIASGTDSYLFSAGSPVVEINITESNLNQTAPFTATYAVVPTGSIAVELNLTDEQGAALNADTDKTYTFTLADANGTAQTVTVTVAAGAATSTATVSDLAQGTYTVSMDTAGLAGDAIASGTDSYLFSAGSPVVEINITESNLNQTAPFTATYAVVPTGSIAVELNLADEQGAALNADTDKTYTFTLADANGTAQTVTVTVAAGAATGIATVSDLAQGTYTVSMDTAGLAGDAIASGTDSYLFSAGSPVVEINITESNLNQTAPFTATYAVVPTGSIAVELNLTDEQGNALSFGSGKTFNFTLTGEGTTQTVTVTLPAGSSFAEATVSGLAMGTYNLEAPVLTGDTVGDYLFQSCAPNAGAVLLSEGTPNQTSAFTLTYKSSTFILSTNATATELQGYLDSYDTVILQSAQDAVADTAVTVAAGETVTVAAGKKLVLSDWVESGTGDFFTTGLNNGGTIVNYGTIEVTGDGILTGDAAGVIDNYGTMLLNGACTNTGIINVKNGGTVDVNSYNYTNAGTWNIEAGGVMTSDTFSNNGTVSIAGQLTVETKLDNTGTVTIEDGGTVINSTPAGQESIVNYAGGNMTVEAGGVLLGTGQVDNLGTLTNNSTVTASGKFRNLDGGTLINNGSFSVEGTFQNGDWTLATGGSDGGTVENNGTFTVLAAGAVDNHAGSFTNMTAGIMDIRGSFTVATGMRLPGHLDNQGTMQISGTLTVAGDPDGTADRQASALYNSGTVTVQEGGTLAIATDVDTVENNGTITCSGTVTNTGGTITNNSQLLIDGGALDNDGTVDNYGRLTVSGATGVLTNRNNAGVIWNNGEMTLSENSTMNNQGSLFNGQSRSDTNVTFTNNGVLNTSGYLENYGKFTNCAEMNSNYFYNYGTFENMAGATVNNTGDFINQMDGEVLNDGAVENTGTVTNDGTYSGSGTVRGTGNIAGTNTEPLLTVRLSTGTYTAEEMLSYFENYKIIIVEGESNVTVSAPVTASEPLTLTDGKSLQIEWDATFTCSAPITVLTGGSMEIGVGGSAATVTMNDALTVNGGALTLINGDFTVSETGSINLESGTMTLQEPSSEYVEIYGRLINNGTVTVGAGATLTACSKILNYGTMTVKASGLLDIAYNSSGTTLYDVGLENGDGAGRNGTLVIEAGATVEMSGIYSSLTQAIHYGILKNHAGSTLTNNGSVTGSDYCKLINDGTYSGSGTVAADIVREGANADQVTVPTP